MTKQFILLIFASLVLFELLSFKNSDNSCSLRIKKGTATKIDEQTNWWIIPTTLTNKTKGTLKYFSMSCSWMEFYSDDNKKLQIDTLISAMCTRNFPEILALAPGESRTTNVMLLIKQTTDKTKLQFRIGFNLMKASDGQSPFDFDHMRERKKENVIWSNQISM